MRSFLMRSVALLFLEKHSLLFFISMFLDATMTQQHPTCTRWWPLLCQRSNPARGGCMPEQGTPAWQADFGPGRAPCGSPFSSLISSSLVGLARSRSEFEGGRLLQLQKSMAGCGDCVRSKGFLPKNKHKWGPRSKRIRSF